MADKTKYYYLKIKESFFDAEEMKILESMDNGYLYSNILMKMYLLSLKNGGKLVFKDKIPYNSKMLSTILNHNVDILEKAIAIFKELNLIEILNTGEIFMLDIQNYIGKSSDEADRKRLYRSQIEEEKNKLLDYEKQQDKCPTNVMTNCANIKDKDINRDKDINITTTTTKDNTLYEYIEKNFGRTISELEYYEIDYWLSLFSTDIIKHSIKIAVLNNKKSFNYVEGILKNWKANGYKTLQEIKDNENKTKPINKKQTAKEHMDEVFKKFMEEDD